MATVITDAAQVTPEWLTGLLRERRALSRGEVLRVTAGELRRTFASTVWPLQASYSRGATLGAPRRLFLKSSSPAQAPGEYDPTGPRQEVVFYDTIAPAMADPPTVPCYHAAYDAETGASHVLLRDLSETHAASPDPEDERHAEQAIEALARLHAAWWDHPRLGRDVSRFPTHQEREANCADAERRTAEFMAALGERLLASWRSAYEGALAALPQLFRRHASGRNLTLAHGDAHLGNYLYPRDPATASALLIDWQFWHATIGGTDLAFMIAGWETALRRRREGPLLRRYHQALLERGVAGYSWPECWDDYRLSVVLVSIFIPVWQWSIFRWEPNLVALERSMTAFVDLRCCELL